MDDFMSTWWFFFLILLPLLVLFLAVTPLLAARKGYTWYLWTFSGGVIGLIILAFLPFANRPAESEEVNRSRRRIGDVIGGVLSVLSLLWMLMRYAGRGNPRQW
jgi:hypothetical protein